VLLTKEGMMLQDMIGRLTETGRCYRMKTNVRKTKVMRISRNLSPLQVMIHQKQLEDVEYFSYLGSMVTDDAICTHDIKSRIAMAKAAFSRTNTLFTANWI
jgi:hypothetical protein